MAPLIVGVIFPGRTGAVHGEPQRQRYFLITLIARPGQGLHQPPPSNSRILAPESNGRKMGPAVLGVKH